MIGTPALASQRWVSYSWHSTGACADDTTVQKTRVVALIFIILGTQSGWTFGAGICAGVFLPVLIAGVLGYGTGSYEDVMFIWLLTVPGCVALSCTAAWRWSAPKAARPEVQ